MDVRHISHEDFNRARMRASVGKITSVLFGKGNKNLLPFEEVKEMSYSQHQSYIGVKTIPIHLIAGSEGRYQDFNRAFLPKREFSRHRWVRVNEARLTDIILPPIQVYELGDIYFVRDGNHRVSVAKMMGIEFIDAEIIKIDSPISLTPDMTIQDIRQKILDYEKQDFFSHPLLGEHILQEELQFTETGRYREVWDHISVHQYYLGESLDRPVPLEEALESWYTTLFTPIMESLRENNCIQRFPGRTTADLYMWIIKHWDELKRSYGEDVTIERATKDFTSQFGHSFFRRIWTKIRRKQHHITTD